jgi:GntR family transcriptional regulator
MIDISHFKVDKKVPIPLYYQLKAFLLAEIQSGRIRPGDSMPTEQELISQLGISRTTIRQALSEMVSEGYLRREKGRGTFVTQPKIEERFFQKLESFNEEMSLKGLVPRTVVLSLKEIPAREPVNKLLEIPEDDSLIYLERLRFANEEPIVYLETFLHGQTFRGLLKENLTELSLYAVLEDKYGASVKTAIRKIEAVAATSQEGKLLNIKKGAPVCLVRTRAFLSDMRPVEYSVARYRGDRNEFTLELERPGE